ncbi:hypothetical protein NDU88_004545 [Pleurodeles waltl]|uniref:Basic proline-rich protein-like n=1 Tax=Pleurodeles waltl TaxID=8319 RepID=A0AAV7UFK6_PLEWA|nr:hypothetical protein NDU88_004545 [Pleurodeles waltl]
MPLGLRSSATPPGFPTAPPGPGGPPDRPPPHPPPLSRQAAVPSICKSRPGPPTAHPSFHCRGGRSLPVYRLPSRRLLGPPAHSVQGQPATAGRSHSGQVWLSHLHSDPGGGESQFSAFRPGATTPLTSTCNHRHAAHQAPSRPPVAQGVRPDVTGASTSPHAARALNSTEHPWSPPGRGPLTGPLQAPTLLRQAAASLSGSAKAGCPGAASVLSRHPLGCRSYSGNLRACRHLHTAPTLPVTLPVSPRPARDQAGIIGGNL